MPSRGYCGRSRMHLLALAVVCCCTSSLACFRRQVSIASEWVLCRPWFRISTGSVGGMRSLWTASPLHVYNPWLTPSWTRRAPVVHYLFFCAAAAGYRGNEQARRFGPGAAAIWAAGSQDRAASSFRRGQRAHHPDSQPKDERGQE